MTNIHTDEFTVRSANISTHLSQVGDELRGTSVVEDHLHTDSSPAAAITQCEGCGTTSTH